MVDVCKTEIMDDTIDRDCACSLELGGSRKRKRKRKQERSTPKTTFKKKRRAEKGKKGREKVRKKGDITTKDGAEGCALVWE